MKYFIFYILKKTMGLYHWGAVQSVIGINIHDVSRPSDGSAVSLHDVNATFSWLATDHLFF